ncbi:MAG TPA: hypothetical protein VMW54_05260 [Terriglobia bacterium]|nr:hypothetical protein [Terriglobia bacterium]
MPNLVVFLVGFAVGVVLNVFLEKRAVAEVQKLHTYVAGEFQKLAAKL